MFSSPTKIQSRPRRSSAFKKYGNIDWIILLLAIGLTLFGGIMIRSVQLNRPVADWWQHWLLGALGVVIALVLARVNYQNFLRWHWYIYVVNIAMLVAVMVVGSGAKGAQRWLNVGGVIFQPSEFAKIALIITLAAVLQRRQAQDFTEFVKALAITVPPWLLVFKQPDLGSSLVFGAIALTMLYWAGAKPGWLLLLASPLVAAILFGLAPVAACLFSINLIDTQICLLSIPPLTMVIWSIGMAIVAYWTLPWRRLSSLLVMVANMAAGYLGKIFWDLLKDYQKDRLVVFLNPETDPLGSGYHLIQSRIAIGAGGFWGQGITHGTQTQLNFIPEQHTDFIFSSIGEECGFVGSMLLLLTFAYLCWRILNIAMTARDNFGSLLVIGILAMIVFQIVVNIGMNVGIAPVTGIPLPWISYGRTALLKNFMAIGLVESVAAFRRFN
jgi:rod shape determining protein RodA